MLKKILITLLNSLNEVELRTPIIRISIDNVREVH